nr:hypothetical protein [Tanacetum cinerariifolium]
VDENKKIQKQLKKANITLAQELKECKAILAETSKSLGEFISVRDSCLFRTQRTVNVAGTREKVGSQPKRVKDSAYHKEKMLLCKQAEQGVPLQAEQYDWLADTDEEVDEQELEAHYSYIAKIQEVPTANSGTDSEP